MGVGAAGGGTVSIVNGFARVTAGGAGSSVDDSSESLSGGVGTRSAANRNTVTTRTAIRVLILNITK